jgi:nucleoside-diphosphate-sugar epimerase
VPYRDKKVLITGGLGFIGSNLAIRLAGAGAHVTIVDSSVPGCGANPYNIEPVRQQVQVCPYPICEPERFSNQISASDVVFNLAGEISHVHSMDFPERDMQINAVAQLQFLGACGRLARGVRMVYASTRQVYGVPKYLPVDEAHPIQPIDFNGVHKYAATTYHLLYSNLGEIDAVALHLTNVYGPRMAVNVPCQGFLSTFLRRLLTGEPLEVFGDGRQVRDPMYVDDAVEAFLLAGDIPRLPSRIYNVGGPKPLALLEIAEMASHAAGGAAVRTCAFPEGRKAIDIGSYYTNCSRIRDELGWEPKVGFTDGIARTLAYYRENLPHYLDPASPRPSCSMPEHQGLRRRLTFANV